MQLALECSHNSISLWLGPDSQLSVEEAPSQTFFVDVVPQGFLGPELLRAIDQLLAAASCTLSQINRIVIGTGPGQFGALRHTISTAKALSRSCNATLVGVPSDAARALAFQQQEHLSRDVFVLTSIGKNLFVRTQPLAVVPDAPVRGPWDVVTADLPTGAVLAIPAHPIPEVHSGAHDESATAEHLDVRVSLPSALGVARFASNGTFQELVSHDANVVPNYGRGPLA